MESQSILLFVLRCLSKSRAGATTIVARQIKKYGIPAPPLFSIQCEMQPVPFSDIPSATLGGEMSDSCL